MSNEHLDICLGCGGPADNGFDRCVPPSPYYCTKCDERLNAILERNDQAIVDGLMFRAMEGKATTPMFPTGLPGILDAIRNLAEREGVSAEEVVEMIRREMEKP